MKPLLFIAAACVVLASAILASASSETDTDAGVTFVNVSYWSGPAPSGNVSLHGTVVLPAAYSPSASIPGIVLVAGSGPNDRWENIGALKPLYYLAVNLAARGFAVLAYDKRTCSGAVHPVCAYRTFCTSPGVPAGCMDIKNNSLYDFSNDAVASAQFLAAYPGVAASNMTIMGHSQGCTVSVQAASTITDLVQNVVLLMGDGVTPDLLLRDQSQAQQPVLRKQLAKVEKLPPSPAQKAAVTEIKGDIAAGECTVTNAVKQFNLIRNGTLAVGDDGVVCPMGTYWKGGFNIPSGVYCPGSCGNHVCLLNVTTPECMADCEYGSGLAACWPIPFAASYLSIAERSSRESALHKLTGRLLALNSWQDLLVVPAVFKPLHTMLEALSNVDVTITTFHNITHDLTNMNNVTMTTVAPVVLAAVDEFFGV